MYNDLIKYFDSEIFKNFGRFDKSITHDYLNDETSFGSFIQFFKVAAGKGLGISSDWFSHIITYKFEPAKLDRQTLFCCEHVFKYLVYKDGYIELITPFQNDVNLKNINNSNNYSHGILPGLLSVVPKIGGGLIDRLRTAIKENRSHHNTTYAYATLGKDNYEKHRDIIEMNSTWRKGKFKKFINSLQGMEHGLLIKHGVENDDNSSYKLLNLNALYRPSRRERFIDRNFKMIVPWDYKLGLNKKKIKLNSFGAEDAVNISHGFRDWIRDKWNKFKNWFHSDKPRKLINNVQNIIKQYAIDILSGRIKIKDIPNKFKNQVMTMIKNKDLTQTPVDEKLNTIIEYANKLKNGQINDKDVPENIKHGIDEYSDDLTIIKPTLPNNRKLMKSRMNRLISYYEKHPRNIHSKDLRKLAIYKFVQSRPNLFKNSNFSVIA